MTELEWVLSTDPARMLEHLGPAANPRKSRLFACAYARTASWLPEMSAWRYTTMSHRTYDTEAIPDLRVAIDTFLSVRRIPARGAAPLTFQGRPPWGDRGEAVVRYAERVADGLVSPEQFAREGPELAASLFRDDSLAGYAGPSAFLEGEESRILRATLAPTGFDAARAALESVRHVFVGLADSGPLRRHSPPLRAAVRDQTQQLQALLLREVFGNVFRPVRFDPAWRGHEDGAVVKLAQAFEEDRDPQRMAILGDALEEAGCLDPVILDHCRNAGEHVRGCWVVDLILDREGPRPT